MHVLNKALADVSSKELYSKYLGFAGHRSLSQLLNSDDVVKKQPQKQVTGHSLLLV